MAFTQPAAPLQRAPVLAKGEMIDRSVSVASLAVLLGLILGRVGTPELFHNRGRITVSGKNLALTIDRTLTPNTSPVPMLTTHV
jgi:hypothetical protein